MAEAAACGPHYAGSVRLLPTAIGIALAVGTLRWSRTRAGARHAGLGLAGLAAAAAFLAYGVGAFDLPDVEETIERTASALGGWTYLLVGVLAFLETGALVGLLVPGETAIIVGGILAGQGAVELVPLIALVWVAAAAGDSVSFLLGRRLGREFVLRHGSRLGVQPAHVERTEAFFSRHGGRAVAFGRFVGVIRAIAPFLAGAARMRPQTFLAYDIPSAAAWATLNVMLGYAVFQSVSAAGAVTKWLTYGLIAAVVVVVVVRRRRYPGRPIVDAIF